MNSENLRRQRRAAGVLAIAAWFCALACVRPSQALAQAEAEAQSSEYRELIDQALSEFKHKNWPEARVLFRRANDLSPSARTQRGIGMVSYEMRDYVNAVTALSSALVDQRQALTDSQRKECEHLLTRSRTFVGAYALKLEPSEAEVSLDGAQLVRDTEGHVLVPFGEHTLRATAPGFQDSISKLVVQGGEQGELRVVLYRPETERAANAAGGGSVEKVVQSQSSTPASGARREPVGGQHPQRFIGHGIRYGWVALGASAAFGAAAAASWFTGQGKVDDLNAACGRAASAGVACERGHVDTAGALRYQRATNALLALSGAALIATGVLFSLEWPTEKRSERALSLDVSPQRLAVRGSF